MKLLKTTLAAVAFAAAGGGAYAATLDLTLEGGAVPNCGSPTAFAGALWEAGCGTQPTGTGVFDPFLTLDQNGENDNDEMGWNTEVNGGNNPDATFGGDRTSGLAYNTLEATTDGNVVFELDINEPVSSDVTKSYISLKDFEVYVVDDVNVGGNAWSSDGTFSGYGGYLDLIYDLDALADNTVNLDYDVVGTGSGASDLFIYLSTALFSGTPLDSYVVVYADLGIECQETGQNETCSQSVFFTADSGFEEFSAMVYSGECPPGSFNCPDGGGGEVPVPASLPLLAGGLGLVGILVRRRKSAA